MGSWAAEATDAYVDILPPTDKPPHVQYFKADLNAPCKWSAVLDYVNEKEVRFHCMRAHTGRYCQPAQCHRAVTACWQSRLCCCAEQAQRNGQV